MAAQRRDGRVRHRRSRHLVPAGPAPAELSAGPRPVRGAGLGGFGGRRPAFPTDERARSRGLRVAHAEHAAGYRLDEHVPGPVHVRCRRAPRHRQPALCRHVWPDAGAGEARHHAAPDPGVSHCHRRLHRQRARGLHQRAARGRARKIHRHQDPHPGRRARVRHLPPADGGPAAGSPRTRTSASSGATRRASPTWPCTTG